MNFIKKDTLITQRKKTKNIDLVINIIIICLLLFVGFAPFLFTQFQILGFSFDKTGQIGDTIGGITSPFVGLIAALLVYKSFNAQMKANEILSAETQYNYTRNLMNDVLELFESNSANNHLNRSKRFILACYTGSQNFTDRDFKSFQNSITKTDELLNILIFLISEIKRQLDLHQRSFYYYKIKLLIDELKMYDLSNIERINVDIFEKYPDNNESIKSLITIKDKVKAIYFVIDPEKITN